MPQELEIKGAYVRGHVVHAPLGALPETKGPFEFTSTDICGPYPVTERGSRYFLTFTDHFTRFPEAIPIPNQDAKRLRELLLQDSLVDMGAQKS
jgi:hypothetical protein